MKKFLLTATAVLLVLSMLGGCSKPQAEAPAATEPATVSTEPATEPSAEPATTEATEAPAVETTPAETEADTASNFSDNAYDQQIGRYYTAISEQWDESTYFDHEMSALAAYYYEGNALDNIGFAFIDLDGNGIRELIIGAIMNAEQDPLVFEVWTLENDEPVMLVQSGSHNRYYLQYAEEDELWYISYEAENGAANFGVYCLQMFDGKLEVSQGIIFDAVASEDAPWFMAYDLDWDVSNDTPTDEDLANAIMDANWRLYTTTEYIPYSQYK